ncbi:MAG: hypothetical protein NE327_21610 [Lentisphaeraceae bacterium]|nr:hypothetical protein [Lentisphaeraceae bacterium]
MGTGLNNSLKYAMLMDSRNGWYYGQRLAISLTVAMAVYTSHSSMSGSKGLELLTFLFFCSLVLITFACISIFSSAVTDDKENGVLPLIMMTGTPSFSYISSKFFTKFLQLLSLLLIMVPPTLFAITLGGVVTSQVIDLYIYLIIWLFFIGAVSFWPSVLFQSRKEASIISAIVLTTLIVIIFFSGYSPFFRLSQILDTTPLPVHSFREIYVYLFIGILSLLSTVKNLHFGTLFPISFIDDYLERMKISRFKGQIEDYAGEKIIIRTPRTLPIMAKDKYLVPYKSIFTENPVTLVAIGAIVLATAPISFVVGYIWLIASPLIYTWKRIIQVISLEIENQTFTSLMALPMSNEELLDSKIQSACLYPAKISFGLLLFPLFIASMASLSLRMIFMTLCLPFLYHSLVHLTAFVTFKTREMVKVTTFTLCLITIVLYFSIPFLAPAFYFLAKKLRTLNISELDKIGEMSD